MRLGDIHEFRIYRFNNESVWGRFDRGSDSPGYFCSIHHLLALEWSGYGAGGGTEPEWLV